MKHSLTLVILATALIWPWSGCGGVAPMQATMTTTADQRTGTSALASSDAEAQPAPTEEQCAGNTLWLHGDHETCDAADIEAAGGASASATTSTITTTTTITTTSTITEVETRTATDTATATATETATASKTSTGTGTGTGLGSNVIEFHIAPGTGKNGYNTAATPVMAKVGQTLRLINDDTVVHRLHTGGVPCPHEPGNTAPGAFYDCVLKSPIDTTAPPGMGMVYDHDAGPTSLFYLKITK